MVILTSVIRTLVLPALSVMAFSATSVPVGAQSNNGASMKNTYSVENYLSIEAVRHAFFSPSGRFSAIEVIKPQSQLQTVLIPNIPRYSSFTDLMILDVNSGRASKVQIADTQSAYAGPWSPDGENLVIFSRSADGHHIRIGVYNALTRAYRRLPGSPARPFFIGRTLPQVVWASDDEVIYAANPEIGLSRYFGGTDHKDHGIASQEILERAKGGNVASAVTQDSRFSGVSREAVEEKLLSVNIKNGRVRSLASGTINGLSLSPDQRRLAAVRLTEKFAVPSAAKLIPNHGHILGELILIELRGKGGVLPITENEYTNERLPITWSSDSTRVGYYSYYSSQKYTSAAPQVYDIPSKRRLKLNIGHLQLTMADLAVSAGTESGAAPVLFLGTNPVIAARYGSSARQSADDWAWGTRRVSNSSSLGLWRLYSDRSPTPFSRETANVDNLCVVSTGLHYTRNGRPQFLPFLRSVRPTPGGRSSQEELQVAHCPYAFYRPYSYTGEREQVVFGVKDENKPTQRLFFSNLPTKEMPVSVDTRYERILDVSPKTGDLLLLREDHSGTHVVIVSPHTRNRKPVLHVNLWLAGLELGERRPLSYTADTPSGKQQLTAWYLTPPNFTPGKQYPVIVDIYPGRILSPDAPPFHPTGSSAFWAPYAAAAEGYIVLKPSMPVDTSERSLNLPRQLSSTTLAAVDALVATGIADPDRIVIKGHSAGAFAVASILTQTNRFKAAIVSAGIYNLTSFYGTADPAVRLEPDGHLHLYGAATVESGQGGMGAPPWAVPDKYIRNSPLFLADKINTRLLILHGERDYVPVQQAEELFTAMIRQRKTARFVRYLGEGHSLESPANFRHAWSEILSWSKEQLGIETSETRRVTSHHGTILSRPAGATKSSR